jgi:predicted transcriptional regulator
MAKTITVRIDDDIYTVLKTAAHGARRTISNFLEYAALAYISRETYATDEEMRQILNDKQLMKDLKTGQKEIREGKYKIVQ